MAYRPIYVNIPEVEAGQVISASLMMNTYGRYLSALLSESQADYSAVKMRGTHNNTTTSWALAETRYMVHAKNTLFYVVAMKVASGGTGYCRITNADGSQVYVELTTTSTSWELKNGTVSSAFSAYESGDLVEIAIRTKSSSTSHKAELKVFAVGQVGVIKTWPAAPAFTDGATSAAADLNAVRDQLMRLENSNVANLAPLLASNLRKTISASGTEEDVMEACYRYRGGDLTVYVETKGGANRWWQLYHYNASAPETLVSSYKKIQASASTDYVWTASAIPMDTHGYAFGDWIRLRLRAGKDTGDNTVVRRVCMWRTSDKTADVTWAVPRTWAEGDTAMGNAELAKLNTDIALLYTGGAEELWGQSIATLATPGTGDGDAEDRTYTGIHRKRWLLCKAHSASETPALLYGYGLAEAVSLPYDKDYSWQVYDMDQYPVPYGAIYMVTGADVALESTIVPTEM